MEKTLGGDRLGSGKKMKVHLHNYERSTHDLGYLWRSTMSSGTLVPFMVEVALPGDTFDINLECDIKTHPTIGPLFGSYKVQLDTFLAPIRLYNSALHNNMLGIGRNMSQVKLPQLDFAVQPLIPGSTYPTNIDTSQVNPSSLPAYMGIRGLGYKNTVGAVTRKFNAIPFLAYWEIYKNYYANKQEEIGAVIHSERAQTNEIDTMQVTTDGTPYVVPQSPTLDDIPLNSTSIMQIAYSSGEVDLDQIQIFINGDWVPLLTVFLPFEDSGTILTGIYNYAAWGEATMQAWNYIQANQPIPAPPEVVTFPLANIDEMRKLILAKPPTEQFNLPADANLTPYTWLTQNPFGPNILSSQEGLAIKTYQSDLFNNWLNTENIEAITTSTAIDTSSGEFTIDQLNLSKKVYNMLNRINVSGGSYDDWIDAVYTHDRYQRAESPMYMGGLIKELVFQEVISNSESPDQPLGTLAGRGILSNKHKGGTVIIKVDEPSYIMGIISLTPRIDYSQGNKWHTHLLTMDDFHKPALDEIGFQELITEQMAWWDTHWNGTTWETKSAGKQPAWINYMTNTNQTYGNFAIETNEMFMTLNRRYQDGPDGYIEDLTTYIDPSKYNFIFAETAIDAQNFWAQIAVDITARRKMSAKIMPNL